MAAAPDAPGLTRGLQERAAQAFPGVILDHRILAEPAAGSSGFHVADELVIQSVPGSVRGSPNRGITLAWKPVTAVMRSSAIVTTCSP